MTRGLNNTFLHLPSVPPRYFSELNAGAYPILIKSRLRALIRKLTFIINFRDQLLTFKPWQRRTEISWWIFPRGIITWYPNSYTCTITIGAWQLEFSNQKSIKTRRSQLDIAVVDQPGGKCLETRERHWKLNSPNTSSTTLRLFQDYVSILEDSWVHNLTVGDRT